MTSLEDVVGNVLALGAPGRTPSISATCRWEMLQGTSTRSGALHPSVVARRPWRGRGAVQIFRTELGKSSFVWDILFVQWGSCSVFQTGCGDCLLGQV